MGIAIKKTHKKFEDLIFKIGASNFKIQSILQRKWPENGHFFSIMAVSLTFMGVPE